MINRLTNNEFFSDPRLYLEVLPRTPQIPYPRHTHDFSELVIVSGGEGIHFIGDEEYLIRSGDIFIIQGERAHGYDHIEGLTLYNIIFDPDLFNSIGEDLDEIRGYHALFKWEPRLRSVNNFESRLRLPPSELDYVLNLVENIEKEIEKKREGYRLMSKVLFLELCGFLSRRYTHSSRQGLVDLSRIAGILTFLENNVNRFLSIGEILEMAGLSESTLQRLFRKTTGFSPMEYHKRLRIRKVCEVLRHSDKTVTEIAYDLGYQDSNYMTRQFRAVTGHTPLNYRKDPSLPLAAE
ncbi:MAG: helix-turn-helix domain-containing protein [Spirochaetales bacterium]|nr:helix-turn-helix domain-containing protein [Spirochaetales bacterium]